MERKSLFYWLAQLAGWGGYFTFSVLLLISTNDFIFTNNLVIYVLSSILFAVGVSHAIRFFILKWNLLNRKLGQLIGYTLLLCIISATLLEVFQYAFEYFEWIDFFKTSNQSEGVLSQEFDIASFVFAVSRSIILYMLWSGFYYVFVIIEKARNQEILNLQWNASKNEIELKNLRAQLNPHFLFNSLNSIRALVGIDPENAKTAITRLSSLLRLSINLGKMRVITLKEELELIQSYLELEKIRFEERLRINYQIAEETLKCELPPLMLQTIVENAIKHGISKEVNGGEIELISRKEGNTLILEVLNTGQIVAGEEDLGVGISNTEKRLAILFAGQSSFDLEQIGNKVKATIKITYT